MPFYRYNGVKLLLALLLLFSGSRFVCAASILSDILKRSPIENPNLSAFPESSLIDCSAHLDVPAGKRGFLSARNGHFYFADGTRARFFGVNLAKDSVFIERSQIDRAVSLFARAGINLVRIHQIDDLQGILDTDPARVFRPDRLDMVDYWVAKLKAQGIYVALDLNDYRTFRASEGVVDGEQLGRGAKPYAVFDQRLVELQEEYAREFLVTHVNPYTKLAYASDPAVAFLEIYDENGLFIRRGDWPTLRNSHRIAFQQAWNAWLRYRYSSTEALKAAWTDRTGYCALQSGESIEQATVQLPRMDLDHEAQAGSGYLVAPARVSDGAVYAYEMQLNFLRVMMGYLRGIGIKIPITAVGAQDVIPDLMATAATTDYIGCNYYWDHPMWPAGQDWTLPSYFSLRDPLTDLDNSFASSTSLARMYNKPLVVREMGYCYPNPYRGAGMLDAAAYGAFLDVDALILFAYDIHPKLRTIGYFDVHLDPLRWGLVALASRIFLSGEVKPANHTVGIGYSDVDAFSWYVYQSPLYQLGFTTRVVNYTDMAAAHPLDLLISSGRSCGSLWLGERLLLFANQHHTDLHYQGVSDGLDERHGYREESGPGGSYDFTFSGIGYDAGTVKSLQAWPPYDANMLLAHNLVPLATANNLALGFLDQQRKVAGFRSLRPELATRIAVDLLHEWYQAPVSHADIDQSCLRTDTGQIERNYAGGLLRINTPTLQAIAGNLGAGGELSAGALKISTTTPIATLVAASLDGKPLPDSENLLVKMTSRAHNDQMKIVATNEGVKPNKLITLGTAPILTDGKETSVPTRVEIGDRLLLEVYLQNGSWELVTEPDRLLLYLDTGDVQVKMPRRPKLVRWYGAGEPVDYSPDSETFTIPAGTLYSEIIW